MTLKNYSAISNVYEVWQECVDQGFKVHDLTEEEATLLRLKFPYVHLYELTEENKHKDDHNL